MRAGKGCLEPQLRGGGGERLVGELEARETARGSEIDRSENRPKIFLGCKFCLCALDVKRLEHQNTLKIKGF